MYANKNIINTIREKISTIEPTATVILYGSAARGEQEAESDIDLLILIDKDHLTPQDKKRIKYPLYDIEIETGRIISPLVLSRSDWENRHSITPFYENVMREGVTL